MKKREKICIWLFEKSKTPYAKHFKRNEPWSLNRTTLLNFPVKTLGNELGIFLNTNNYQLIPKLEKHDAYHLITGFGTSVKEEIALQYFFLGSKKKSIYLYAVILIGGSLLPEYFLHFYKSYQKGKNTIPFYNWNIKELLGEPLSELQEAIYFSDENNTVKSTKRFFTSIYNPAKA